MEKKEKEDNPAAKRINRAKLPTTGSQYLGWNSKSFTPRLNLEGDMREEMVWTPSTHLTN